MCSFFNFQGPVSEVMIKTDANWAGCKETRKSTSGGCVFMGEHLINIWSKTQHAVATSSAESESIAMIKGTSEGIGIARTMAEFGENIGLRLWADASAALALVEREGSFIDTGSGE